MFAIVEAVGLDPLQYSINRSSLQRARKKHRKAAAEKLKEMIKDSDLDLRFATLHWDGKILQDLTGSEKCDRLAIIITSGDFEQILSIPKLERATGRAQADACFEQLVDWGLVDVFETLCCDRTSSNLGRFNGAAVHVEHSAKREILYFPCRRHGKEVVLRGGFDSKSPPSKSPEVQIFNRFKKAWHEMNHKKFDTDPGVMEILKDDIKSILDFTEKVLATAQPRDNYLEFLRLTQIFVGKVENAKFSPPGPTHHARWMAKAIYCLKIHLFRDQFEFRDSEEEDMKDLCIFIVKLYVKAWFTAPLTVRAPNHDLEFLKKLIDYKSINAVISQATVAKMKNHLYYLIPEACGLSFYDETISIEIKKKMVLALTKESPEDCGKRIILRNVEEIKDKDISDFICKDTCKFFDRFGLSKEFLKSDPSTWLNDEQYQKDLKNVRKLKSVNDVAERGVKLVEEYNRILTKDEEQHQFILKLVSDYRKRFPKVSKETLSKPM